jgi:hypothetical protein
MNVHEYQAKELLRRYNVPLLNGKVAFTVDEAVKGAQALGGNVWVVKAQIHAGGRGKGGGKDSVYVHAVARGGIPEEKPEPLIAELIRDFTDEGDLILDPWAGHGTTGRVAKDLGRRAILVEIDERRAEVAARRMAQASLFSPRPKRSEQAPLFDAPKVRRPKCA